MLIEFHLIQNHAPSNLNRDDTGSPKEAVFGGYQRARISSQCLKRSIRRSELFQEALKGHLATRSRQIAARLRPALERLGDGPEAIEAVTKVATRLGSDKESDKGETRQTMFVADAEISRVAEQLYALYQANPEGFSKLTGKELDQKLKNDGIPPVVDIALFGRMTTAAAFEDVRAAMQVAHAISTGKIEREFDYYTAVDDLPSPDDDLGADMIGDVEFNSSTFYKYFSLDWKQLCKNLDGDTGIARKAVAAFLEAAALVTPTGKQNSFAAHNPPDGILVEVRTRRIPVSYANAYITPVRPTATESMVERSVQKLGEYAERLKKSYGLDGQAFWLTTTDYEMPGARKVESLQELVGALDALLAEAQQ